MAAYPAFAQLLASQLVFADDLAVDTAVNGTSRARAFYTSKKAQVTLKHVLNDTDLATLESFYDANRLLVVTLTWQRDGSTYDCFMLSPPKDRAIVSGGLTQVTMSLVEQ